MFLFLQIIKEALTVASHCTAIRFSPQIGITFVSVAIHFISDSLSMPSTPSWDEGLRFSKMGSTLSAWADQEQFNSVAA